MEIFRLAEADMEAIAHTRADMHGTLTETRQECKKVLACRPARAAGVWDQTGGQPRPDLYGGAAHKRRLAAAIAHPAESPPSKSCSAPPPRRAAARACSCSENSSRRW